MDPLQATRDKPVPVKITLKGEPLLSFARAEFNDSVLGESQRLDSATDLLVEYKFTCSFDCYDGTITLDDIAQKPIILTVLEILPKEKKQKEEKTSVLGQAVVDLVPLLQGEMSFTATVPLHPTPGAPGEIAQQDSSCKVMLPTLDVTICTPEPLLSDVQLSQSNLLKVVIETAYSVPEVWSNDTGLPFNYVAALQVPLSTEKDQVLLFSNGVLKMGGERETVPRPKRWPLGPMLAPGAQFIPGGVIGEPTEMEVGDLTSTEEKEFRVEVETNRKRVSWDTERRCFMDAGAVACLIRRIVDCRLWPVEVMRSPDPGVTRGGKQGKDKPAEDEIQIPFHGVAYLDMVPLLYPGVKHIRGAYLIYPFYETDLQAKTKQNTSVLRETMRMPALQGRGQASSNRPFDTQKAAKETKEAPKKGVLLNADLMSLFLLWQMYTEARTYIVIEISLEKPLLPKRPPEELAKRVMELIPPRPPLPRRPAGAERAVLEYQAQINSVTGQILEQYQQLFGAALVSGSQPLDLAAQEQRKTQLIGELNYSGKYFAFKEQIKHSVVRIAREKMLRTEAFTDQEQLQGFLSQLYVFLVDEMHVALNKILSVDAPEDQPGSPLNCAQLKHFALEAQLNQDYQLAATYYQEVLLTVHHRDPGHWFDYGVFHLLTKDYLKAEECLRQAVSVNQSHVPSLLMCGILAEMAGHFEEAETFIERATRVAPTSVTAWTLFGLFYEGQENAIQAEMAFLEANKQLKTTPANAGQMATDSYSNQGKKELGGTPTAPDPRPVTSRCHSSSVKLSTTIYMETVRFLLDSNALQMAQRALAQELLCPEGGPSSSYYLALARLQLLSGDFGSAEVSLKEALKDTFENPDVWAWSGHLHFLTGSYGEAKDCYKRTLDLVADPADTHAVYLRLAEIYLKEGKFEKAKTTYMRACKSSPSCLTWLGLGIACYQLGELTEAEDALMEANVLNNTNAEVWGYLSLVCLQAGKRLEAEQSYKYAIKLDLQNEKLLQEIKELQAQVRFGNPWF
uniref:Cilia and flagella associated protein 70 n=1 Tax=Scleropages formosus TaxID=113540 RepID=A0A8C9VVL7_SCLFO